MYASSRPITHGSRPSAVSAALMPAAIPWAAASSYPVVPFTWPAKYRPGWALTSSVASSWWGGKKSYSIA